MMKKHPLLENYERFFGRISESVNEAEEQQVSKCKQYCYARSGNDAKKLKTCRDYCYAQPGEFADARIYSKSKDGVTYKKTEAYIREADSDISDVKNMSFTGIVDLIYRDWKKVNYGAKPYLEAMSTMSNVTDKYMFDSGPSIIRYFLANATSWKGEVAKAVKAELNRRIKGKY